MCIIMMLRLRHDAWQCPLTHSTTLHAEVYRQTRGVKTRTTYTINIITLSTMMSMILFL